MATFLQLPWNKNAVTPPNLLLTSWPCGDWNSCATAAKASKFCSWGSTGTTEAVVTGNSVSGWGAVGTVQPQDYHCLDFSINWPNYNFTSSSKQLHRAALKLHNKYILFSLFTFNCRGRDNDSICHIHQRLKDVHVKYTILLPQVQHTDNFALIKKKKRF